MKTEKRVRLKIGDRRGRLVVLGRARERSSGRASWSCICDCGSGHIVRGDHLQAGLIVSCGCFRSEHAGEYNLVHGNALKGFPTREYRIWQNMLARCYKPICIVFHRYGKVGVAVCERWRDNFSVFLQDMGPAPTPQHSIDRYPDGAGNYRPDNCRWATPSQQTRNRKNTVRILVGGENIPLAEACERFSIKYKNAYALLRAGRSGDHIFNRGGA